MGPMTDIQASLFLTNKKLQVRRCCLTGRARCRQTAHFVLQPSASRACVSMQRGACYSGFLDKAEATLPSEWIAASSVCEASRPSRRLTSAFTESCTSYTKASTERARGSFAQMFAIKG